MAKIPSAHNLKELGCSVQGFADLFVRRLGERSKVLGMEIKEEETWYSTVLFEYSKKYHLRGSEVSSALKKASRMGSDSNDGIKTLSNRVSSAFFTGISVAAVDSTPNAAYILAVMEACRIFLEEADLSEVELAALCLVDRHIGGYPVVNFSGFCFRVAYGPPVRRTGQLDTIGCCGHRDLCSSIKDCNRVAVAPLGLLSADKRSI